MMQVPLSGCDITGLERAAVDRVLRSGVLSLGPAVVEFESLVRQRIGTRHAVAVNSGTSALHLLIRAFGIKDGAEVITTPFSFVASANCILFERAFPVFVDIDPDTWNIDPARVEAAITRRTRAILPVDVFGLPVDIRAIRRLASRHKLYVIEDACEAFGSKLAGVPVGRLADGAAFAFYPNKQITTGEGGMVVTNDDRVARLCRSRRNQGRDHGPWLRHDRLGYNYRLSELHAALGTVQVRRLDELMHRREEVARAYDCRLRNVPDVTVQRVFPEVTRLSRQAYVVKLRTGIDRDRVIADLVRHGISSRPYFTPIHLQPFYVRQFGYRPGDFPVAEEVGAHTIALPFHSRLTVREIDYVVARLKRACTRYRQ